MELVPYAMIIMMASVTPLAFSTTPPEGAFIFSLLFMYTIGYPVSHTAILGVFSKVVKKGPRGKCFGLFGSAGSITRIVAPILAGILAEKAGENIIFIMVLILLLIGIILFVLNMKMIQDVVNENK